jgi:hypothetical protein
MRGPGHGAATGHRKDFEFQQISCQNTVIMDWAAAPLG